MVRTAPRASLHALFVLPSASFSPSSTFRSRSSNPCWISWQVISRTASPGTLSAPSDPGVDTLQPLLEAVASLRRGVRSHRPSWHRCLRPARQRRASAPSVAPLPSWSPDASRHCAQGSPATNHPPWQTLWSDFDETSTLPRHHSEATLALTTTASRKCPRKIPRGSVQIPRNRISLRKGKRWGAMECMAGTARTYL